MRVSTMVLAATALLAAPAAAHMPYLLPALFDAGSRDRVTLEAAFTEDAFRPEVAMRDAPFEVTAPDGTTTRLAAPLLAGDRTLAEAALPADGIYRLSSGQRVGRMGKMYRIGAGWAMAGEGAAPPAGAALVDVRSMTLADAYVLRGRPGTQRGALAPRGKALEIHPFADPTAIAPGTALRIAVLYDGKPLAGVPVALFREAGLYDGRKQPASATTDAAGTVAITAPDAGRYLLLVRHRPATPGTDGVHASYTTTLAFEAG